MCKRIKSCVSLLCMLALFGFTQLVNAQSKNYLIYETDFTDWGVVSTVGNSSDVVYFTGGGEGFYADQRPLVYPKDSIGGFLGYYTANANYSYAGLNTKALNFSSGGILELTLYREGSLSRYFTVPGATQMMVKEVFFEDGVDYSGFSIGDLVLGYKDAFYYKDFWITGNVLKTRGVGYVKVWCYLPDLEGYSNMSFTGVSSELYTTTPVYLVDLKIYNVVDTEPTVFLENVFGGESISIGAGKQPDIQEKVLKIGGFNLTGDVKVSIDSLGAVFSVLSDSIISATDIMNGDSIMIGFIPSVTEGIKRGRLKIESDDLASPLYYNLLGITGSEPELLVPTDTIKLWSRLAEQTSYKLTVEGINITNDVALSISGTDAMFFSLSTDSVSKNGLLDGVSVNIKYSGGISQITHNATLKLSSTGVDDVYIPIVGVTEVEKPIMYPMSFVTEPEGAANIRTSLVGEFFPSGTKINVSVTPESGYAMYYWSDGKAGALVNRTVTVSSLKNGVITVNLKPIVTSQTPISTQDSLIAYAPTDITNTSLTASWSAVSGASSYTVTVYDDSGYELTELNVVDSSVVITNLSPGVGYTYRVKADTGEESTLVGPFSTTAVIESYSCGK